MHDAAVVKKVRGKFAALDPVMDERVRRQWAASEAMALGWGGIEMVAVATGMSRTTIGVGMRELRVRAARPKAAIDSRVRRLGGGRKRRSEEDPKLREALEALELLEAAGSMTASATVSTPTTGPNGSDPGTAPAPTPESGNGEAHRSRPWWETDPVLGARYGFHESE